MLAETHHQGVLGVYTHLCSAVNIKNFLTDQVDADVAEKDFYLSLTGMEIGLNVIFSLGRELTTIEIGSVTQITRPVVRTYPVHTELEHSTCR